MEHRSIYQNKRQSGPLAPAIIRRDNMAKDAIVSDDFAKKFAAEKETPYTRWVKSEGLDLISSTYVQNLNTVELKPWARRGGRGVFMNHEASRTSNDCYVCEIPPGKTLSPQRQLFEETIMILSGRGSTTVWNDAGQPITFELPASASLPNGRPANCAQCRLPSGISTSTAPAAIRRVSSRSPTRRSSSTST